MKPPPLSRSPTTKSMQPKARAKFYSLLQAATRNIEKNDFTATLEALEKAHFLGQKFAPRHAQVHFLMFLANLKMKNFGEALGQFLFVFVGFFGSLLGFTLQPNAGRFFAKNSIHKEIPKELKSFMSDQ